MLSTQYSRTLVTVRARASLFGLCKRSFKDARSPTTHNFGSPSGLTVHGGKYEGLGVPLNHDASLLFLQTGYVKALLFNNHRHLNRFDEKQLGELFQTFRHWNVSPVTRFILMSGTGTSFFSAGLHQKSLQKYLEKNDKLAATYLLRESYKFGYYAANMETATASIMNGAMMGFGAQLGLHSNYAIITPGAVLACPEVSYGYIPEGGNTYNLSFINRRFPGVGTFIAMTGSSIRSTDLLAVGLGSHYCGGTGIIQEVIKAFQEKGVPTESLDQETVHRVMSNYLETNTRPLSFTNDLYALNKLFHGHKTFTDFMNNLNEAANKQFGGGEVKQAARSCLNKFAHIPPRALSVVWKVMMMNEGQSMGVCMKNEFRAAVRLQRTKDYKNGLAHVMYDRPLEAWEPAFTEQELKDFTEKPLSLSEDGTCDLQFPEEVFMGEQIMLQYERMTKEVK
ncbi:3-hydroxyisobutyryl-CoA hydrolase [Acrasis kona]|uniref:3-hydroxyisobutyryl-CoA hydrolase n=1 Tax=Acrasis kona TaxID=1008807 RepID=A0AAW2YYZ0_9EUKA